MRAAILVMIIAASVPYIFLKPHVGVLVWSWLAYMNPHRLTWGFSHAFSYAQIIGIVTLIAWLFSKEPKRVPLTLVTVLLAIWAGWMTVTTVFGLVPFELRLEKWTLVMKILLMTFVTMALIYNRERLNALIWVIALSIGFFGIKGGIWVLMTGGQYMVLGPPGSFIAGNNELALALVLVLPLFRYLQLQARNKWIAWGCAASMVLLSLSIISTYSRGCFLALMAMFAVLWLRSKRKLLIGSTVVIGMLAVVAFMPQKWIDEIKSIQDYKEDESAGTRFKMWSYGIKVAKQRPVTGGGFGIYPYEPLYPRFGFGVCQDRQEARTRDCVVKYGRSSHSIYFQALGEHGVVGLLIFLALGAATLWTGSWIVGRTRDRPDLAWARDLAIMLQISLVGFAVGATFYNRAYFDLYYHLIAIMVLTRAIVAKALEERPDAAEEDGRAAKPPSYLNRLAQGSKQLPALRGPG